jgi:uncharacterized protein YycO
MQHVQVVFSRSHTIGSLLIRLFTWSTWSHIAIVDKDEVIEAIYPKVRRVSLDEFAKGKSKIYFDLIPCHYPEAIISAANSQVGKRYDIAAIFAIFFRGNWHDLKKWFCSELIAWAFWMGGTPLFRDSRLRRVTPEHIWMIAPIQKF